MVVSSFEKKDLKNLFVIGLFYYFQEWMELLKFERNKLLEMLEPV